jgi:hypothetical protein
VEGTEAGNQPSVLKPGVEIDFPVSLNPAEELTCQFSESVMTILSSRQEANAIMRNEVIMKYFIILILYPHIRNDDHSFFQTVCLRNNIDELI